MIKETPISSLLIERYGRDFRQKLNYYRTASWKGQPVAIMEVDTRTLAALVKIADGKHHSVSVNDLTDFVL